MAMPWLMKEGRQGVMLAPHGYLISSNLIEIEVSETDTPMPSQTASDLQLFSGS